MSQRYLTVPVPGNPESIVVRPSSACCRFCGHSLHTSQILILFNDGVRELELSNSSPTCSQVPLEGLQLRGARSATYEPTTESVVVAEQTRLLRLASDNSVALIAGSSSDFAGEQVRADGRGEAARFTAIKSLVADGRGNVYVAEADCIRKVDVNTGEVSTLPGSAPQQQQWTSLAYDASDGVLLAATRFVVYRVEWTVRHVGAAGPVGATQQVYGSTFGSLEISAIFAGAHRKLYVLNGLQVTQLDLKDGASRAVGLIGQCHSWPGNMTVLPTGQLAFCDTLGQQLVLLSPADNLPPFAASSPALGGWVSLKRKRSAPPDILSQLALPVAPPPPSPRPGPGEGATGAGAATSSGSPAAAAAAHTVTVRFDDGNGFLAHRSVLAAHSEYFRRLLVSEGGDFADCGAAEVRLRDASAEVFGLLLAYMYGNALVVPDELLRPAAEVAGRLLMPAECTAQLQAWLLEACSPATVVSELLWAAQHDMADLVARLKAFLLRHRREVSFDSEAVQLAAKFPEMAAELLQLMAAAGDGSSAQ